MRRFAVNPPQPGPWVRGGRWSHTLLPARCQRLSKRRAQPELTAGSSAMAGAQPRCGTRLPVLRSSCSEPLLPDSSCTVRRGKLVEQRYCDTEPWKAKVSPFGRSLGKRIGARQQKACSEPTSHPGDIKSQATPLRLSTWPTNGILFALATVHGGQGRCQAESKGCSVLPEQPLQPS